MSSMESTGNSEKSRNQRNRLQIIFSSFLITSKWLLFKCLSLASLSSPSPPCASGSSCRLPRFGGSVSQSCPSRQPNKTQKCLEQNFFLFKFFRRKKVNFLFLLCSLLILRRRNCVARWKNIYIKNRKTTTFPRDDRD